MATDSIIQEITAAVVEAAADVVYDFNAAWDGIVKPTYPADHKAAMRVPKGGSSCASCEYVSEDKKECSNVHFIKYNGSKVLPAPADEYCSDWYEPKKKLEAASETSGDVDGTLWNGIKITGFTGPEEEGIRALLSRIPPELFYNVKELKSAPELGAKHGRFIPETQTVLFNPDNFFNKQRMGKGEGWVYHPELTAVHEIGHSLYEVFTPEQKQAWADLSGWMEGWKPGQSVPYQEKRPGWGDAISKYTHKAGVLMTRHYAERNPNEDWADCFAFVILGKGHQMDPNKKKFVDDFLKAKVKAYPQFSIQSPSKPYAEKSPTPKSLIANKESSNLYNNLEAYGTSTGAEEGWDKRGRGRKQKEKDPDRAARAKASHVDVTEAIRLISTACEIKVAKAIGGKTTGMQSTVSSKGRKVWYPFDVMSKNGRIGIEVRAMHPLKKGEAFEMKMRSRVKKIAEAEALKLDKVFLVGCDLRHSDGVRIYYRQGIKQTNPDKKGYTNKKYYLGKWRPSTMTETTLKGLKDVLQ